MGGCPAAGRWWAGTSFGAARKASRGARPVKAKPPTTLPSSTGIWFQSHQSAMLTSVPRRITMVIPAGNNRAPTYGESVLTGARTANDVVHPRNAPPSTPRWATYPEDVADLASPASTVCSTTPAGLIFVVSSASRVRWAVNLNIVCAQTPRICHVHSSLNRCSGSGGRGALGWRQTRQRGRSRVMPSATTGARSGSWLPCVHFISTASKGVMQT